MKWAGRSTSIALASVAASAVIAAIVVSRASAGARELVSASSVVAAAPSVSTGAAPVERVIARARLEVSRGVDYDPAYSVLTFRDEHDTRRFVYPNGDVNPKRGVCTDLVVRAFRAAGTDFQETLHRDIVAHPKAYWVVARPDANIDHRRVHPLMIYLDRVAQRLPTTVDTGMARTTWRPGDIVTWAFNECPKCVPNHVGIVSDKIGIRGLPLVLHNLGPHPTEDDMLDRWTILRHFRVRLRGGG